MISKLTLFLVLLSFVFLSDCNSTQPMNSPLDAVKSTLESNLAHAIDSGDTQNTNSINLCLGSIRGLESEVSKLRSDLQICNNEKTKIENEFKELMEDYAFLQSRAGRADMIDSQITWIGFLLVFVLIGSIIYLVYAGKIRIPGFLG